MVTREEIDQRLQELARLRDELIVKANLAKLEAREEWAELEAKMADLKEKAGAGREIAGETARDVAESAREIAADLQKGYERLRGLF